MKKVALLLAITMLAACSKQSYEEHVVKAKQFIGQNDISSAEIELKNAIRLQPKDAETRFLLGEIYLKQRKFESAEKELNRALSNGYDVAKVMPLLSKAYHNSGTNLELTKLKYKKAGLKPQQAIEVAYYKLKAFIDLGKTEKAKAVIRDIKQHKVDSSFKSLALVYGMLMQENEAAAQLILDEVLTKDANQPDALKLKAELLLKAKKPEEAVIWLKSYYQSYPEDHQISFLLARLLTDLNQTKEAEAIVDKLLEINNKHVLLNQLKAVARYAERDFENTLEYAVKVVNEEPNNTAARVLAGFSAYFLKDYASTNTHLSAIAGNIPEDHAAIRLLAASQLELGQTMAASDSIDQLGELQQQDASLLSSVGLSLVKSGEIDKAKKVVDKVEVASDDAKALTKLGILKLSLNDLDGITQLEQADALESDKSVTRKTLATAYLSTKNYQKALELANKWKQDKENNEGAWLLAGIVYLQQGDFNKAKQELNSALSNEKSIKQALILLSEVEQKQGNLDKASSLLNRLLKLEPANIPALSMQYLIKKKQGESNELVEQLKSTFKADADNQVLGIFLAKLLLQEAQVEQGIKLLKDISNKEEIHGGYWPTLAQAYWQKKDFVAANKHFKEWLEVQPNNQSALLGNLIMLDGQHEFEQGLKLVNKYLDKDNTNEYMKLLKAHFLIMNNDFTAAKTLFNELPENFRVIPFAKGLSGMMLFQEGKYSESVERLFQAYEVLPRARTVRVIYIALLRQNKKAQGEKFIAEHVKNHPNDIQSLMLLANTQIATNVEQAIKSYENILQLQDNNLVALNNLAYFYMQKNDIAKAKRNAEKAYSISPNNPDVLDTLAQILSAENNYEEALQLLAKAVSNENVKEEVYLNYIEALARNNQIALANRKLSQRQFIQQKSKEKVAQLIQQYNLQ